MKEKMENKNSKSIVLIALAVFSIVMILANGNIEKVYAITLVSAEPDGSMGTVTDFEYNSAHDYIITSETEGGFVHVHIVNAETLALVADIVTTIVNGGDLDCSASVCFVVGNIANVPTIARISLSSLTVVATYTESEYGICGSPSGTQVSGTSVFVLMGGGSCPYSGIYNIPVSFTADIGGSNIQWNEYDSTTSFGNIIGESCLVNGNYYHFDTNNQRVRKYSLGSHTITSSNALGALITHGACDTDFSTGYAYATSINGDWVKRIALDDLTVDGTSFSITNPQYVLGRGDSVYVSRDDATTVTAISKADWASAITLFSGLAHNDVILLKGNATRMNMIAPTTNDNIYYTVDGLFDSDEELEDEDGTTGGGSANGVCLNVDANGDGRVNVLDCAGSNTAFSGFTSGQNVSTIVGRITDGLGLTDTESNPDIETNGVGLFMFLGLLILTEFFILAGYLGFTSKTNTEKSMADMALIVLIGAFADLSIAFYLNWLPDIVFYTVIVLVAGFLTFGILGKMRGR